MDVNRQNDLEWAPADRVSIDDVGRGGLVLSDGATRWSEPSSRVGEVIASRVPDGRGRFAVLALGIGERTLLVAETEDIWPWLTAVLHPGLDDIDVYDHWARAIMADPEPRQLYPR